MGKIVLQNSLYMTKFDFLSLFFFHRLASVPQYHILSYYVYMMSGNDRSSNYWEEGRQSEKKDTIEFSEFGK